MREAADGSPLVHVANPGDRGDALIAEGARSFFHAFGLSVQEVFPDAPAEASLAAGGDPALDLRRGIRRSAAGPRIGRLPARPLRESRASSRRALLSRHGVLSGARFRQPLPQCKVFPSLGRRAWGRRVQAPRQPRYQPRGQARDSHRGVLSGGGRGRADGPSLAPSGAWLPSGIRYGVEGDDRFGTILCGS